MLGSSDSGNVLSRGSGGCKSEVTVLAGLVPPEAEGGSSPGLCLLASSGLLVIFGISCLTEAPPNSCLHVPMAFSLCSCLCPHFTFFKRC